MSIVQEFPILEFDPEREAFIEPSRLIKPIGISERCVICFFKEVVDSLAAQGKLHMVTELRCECGTVPIFPGQFSTLKQYLPPRKKSPNSLRNRHQPSSISITSN